MGRPPRYDVDGLLDTAASLVTSAGPRSATVAAVTRRAGVPSGSVYHRFPGRSALLAALWLRTVDRFQSGFLVAVRITPPREAIVAAAHHVVEWSRRHPEEARILLYGPGDFDEPDWPSEAQERLRESNRRVADTVHGLAARLGWDEPHGTERVFLATVDLPYATVRRHLLSGESIPEEAESVLAESVRGLLAGVPTT